MRQNNQNIHHNTPTVGVVDNRGLGITQLAYCRNARNINGVEERKTTAQYDPFGNLESSKDAKLSNSNFQYQYSVTGQQLQRVGVDNGKLLSLHDIEARPMWQQDARKTITKYDYDNQMGRIEAIREQRDGEDFKTKEKFEYGGDSDEEKERNLCNQLVVHYDPAGLQEKLTISMLEDVQTYFRKPFENFVLDVDWEFPDSSDLVLAHEECTAITYNALGKKIFMTDATGYPSQFIYDLRGQLKREYHHPIALGESFQMIYNVFNL